MSNISYKDEHVLFLSNESGTSKTEILILVNFTALLICLYCTFGRRLSGNSYFQFILQFSFIIVPIILFVTVLNNEIKTINNVILLVTYFFLAPYLFQNNICNYDFNRPGFSPKPIVTYFRAIIFIITSISILAVDFKVFPRRFSKTDTYGYGLMDTGVGFFIVANGIALSPFTLELRPSYIAFRIFTNKILYSCIVFSVLSLLRLYFIDATDYQNPVKEYGTRCNFFTILFLTEFLSLISCKILFFFGQLSMKSVRYLSISLLFAHQIILSCGVQDWAVSDIRRDNFFNANREGILCLMGYLSLYLYSFLIRVDIYRSLIHSTGYNKLMMKSFLFLVLTCACEICFDVSRRFANSTYILWILTLTYCTVAVSRVTELLICKYKCLSTTEHYDITVPTLLEAINYNGLIFFITTNLTTGVINLCFYTIYLDDVSSLIIIFLYMFVNCWLMWILFKFKIKLSFVNLVESLKSKISE